VGKAWGLKTTLPQTPHSAGSLRHWVRPFYMDPAEDIAIFPVSRAASYRWKGILSTSTVCFYSRNLLQQLLACFLLLLVPTIDQDETFL